MNIGEIPDAFPALFRLQSTWIMSAFDGLYQVLYGLAVVITQASA